MPNPDYGRMIYIGCYHDTPHRDLPVGVGRFHTANTCRLACAGYLYFAIQDRDECWCGNAYATQPEFYQEASVACSGMAGGHYLNSIFTLDDAVCAHAASVPGVATTYPETGRDPNTSSGEGADEAAQSALSCVEIGWPPNRLTSLALDDRCGASKVDNGGCSGNVTYILAQLMCAGHGARLCTASELKGNVARQTGCLLDRRPVWTSHACDGGGHWVVGGSSKASAFEPQCAGLSVQSHVRCCADVLSDGGVFRLQDVKRNISDAHSITVATTTTTTPAPLTTPAFRLSGARPCPDNCDDILG